MGFSHLRRARKGTLSSTDTAEPFARHRLASMDRVAPTAQPQQVLASALRSWRPHKTPRVTGGLFLWLFGLWAALYAVAPPVSPKAERAFQQAMYAADALLPARSAAQAVLQAAQYDTYSAKTWFWRFSEEDRRRVRRAQAVEAEARAGAARAHAEWLRASRTAKQSLGLWSDVGVAEARQTFWKAYKEGKMFAQRHTVWDVVFAIMYGRTGSEENVLSFVIQWVGIALRCVLTELGGSPHALMTLPFLLSSSNFTVGMISAVLSFMFALPGLIWSYGASVWSGVLFFVIASVAASSVVTTYLGALYGTAAVGTYYAIKAAGAQPRLAYSRQHRRYQVTPGRRPHAE